MMEFNKLTIRNLYKSFGELKVLKDFNLTLERGEFITFLGPSGCGKSTALNCISGLIPLTSGEIFIDDECIDNAINIHVPPEKRGFGMVFQNYALFPHLSVYKNVAFGLELKKLDKKTIDERVEKALSMVHLEGYSGKYPAQMSGGQQQRVAIARCIVLEPRLLLFDEPLSNLDAKLRIEMRYEIKSLHERLQTSTIYVTHDQSEALALSDKIVVMKVGYVQQIGTPEEIYSRPSNLFVADFMGFRNLWPARIERINENGNVMEISVNVNGSSIISRMSFTEKDTVKKFRLKQAYENREEVVTAIRPEDISLSESSNNSISCKVELVEYLGQANHITAFFGNGTKIDARPYHRVDAGGIVNLYIPPEKMLIFPKEEE